MSREPFPRQLVHHPVLFVQLANSRLFPVCPLVLSVLLEEFPLLRALRTAPLVLLVCILTQILVLLRLVVCHVWLENIRKKLPMIATFVILDPSV